MNKTNWKTLVGGIVAGGGVAFDAVLDAYNSGAFTGKTGGKLVLAIGLIVLGVFAKDRNVTGGTKQQ